MGGCLAAGAEYKRSPQERLQSREFQLSRRHIEICDTTARESCQTIRIWIHPQYAFDREHYARVTGAFIPANAITSPASANTATHGKTPR